MLKGYRQNLPLYLPKYIVYPQWCVGMLPIHLFLHPSWFNTSSMLFAVLHHDKFIVRSLASSWTRNRYYARLPAALCLTWVLEKPTFDPWRVCPPAVARKSCRWFDTFSNWYIQLLAWVVMQYILFLVTLWSSKLLIRKLDNKEQENLSSLMRWWNPKIVRCRYSRSNDHFLCPHLETWEGMFFQSHTDQPTSTRMSIRCLLCILPP